MRPGDPKGSRAVPTIIHPGSKRGRKHRRLLRHRPAWAALPSSAAAMTVRQHEIVERGWPRDFRTTPCPCPDLSSFRTAQICRGLPGSNAAPDALTLCRPATVAKQKEEPNGPEIVSPVFLRCS